MLFAPVVGSARPGVAPRMAISHERASALIFVTGGVLRGLSGVQESHNGGIRWRLLLHCIAVPDPSAYLGDGMVWRDGLSHGN